MEFSGQIIRAISNTFDSAIHGISYVTVFYLISVAIAVVVVFGERKDPSRSLAWLMILFLIPYLGIILYLLFSQNMTRKKIFSLTKHEDMIIGSELRHQMIQVKNDEFPFARPEMKKWKDMILLHQSYARALFSQDNKIEIYTNGQAKFENLFKAIEEAKETIHVMYFIIKNDEMGNAFMDLLTKKVQEGVTVRLLADSTGSSKLWSSSLNKFREAGGRCASFFPPVLKILNLKVNYRNHRKMVIIDGKIAYLGGFNVGNAYVDRSNKFGHWRDTHLKLEGSCVQDINARFILDWRFAHKEEEELPLSEAYAEPAVSAGTTGIQIVASGPDSGREEILHGYLKMISNAKKNIYIQTPYFVPDNSLQEALRNAIYSGVDVRIMIPNQPDHPFVYWATYSYVGDLLEAGARVYTYEGGFLHAKTICADGEAASVGSANFDIRSFRLSFEANAFIYDSEEAVKMEKIFEEDILHSRALTIRDYRKRSWKIKFKESFSRLFSELL
ncbi:MAG: cardiolipin synthase [Firmicutes bacterium]|nr:cardiolipin synthase [Bacillota bacterium]